MSKAILMSIKPEWLKLILDKKKTIEIRKTVPKCELPIDVYLYCAKDRYKEPKGIELVYDEGKQKWCEVVRPYGKVVGKFILYDGGTICFQALEEKDSIFLKGVLNDTCLTIQELRDYFGKVKQYKLGILTNWRFLINH